MSAFHWVDLDSLINSGRVKPMVNQVLAHGGDAPFDLIDHGRSHDILVEAAQSHFARF